MIVLRTRAHQLWRFAGGAALAVTLTTSERASACGGFWCSVANPVEQTNEQIVFVQNGDGTTTCVVDIAYQGPSEHFAWVLPVEGVPQIDVSSGMAFDRLAAQTAPQYVMNRHVEGQCDQPPPFTNCGTTRLSLTVAVAVTVPVMVPGLKMPTAT